MMRDSTIGLVLALHLLGVGIASAQHRYIFIPFISSVPPDAIRFGRTRT